MSRENNNVKDVIKTSDIQRHILALVIFKRRLLSEKKIHAADWVQVALQVFLSLRLTTEYQYLA